MYISSCIQRAARHVWYVVYGKGKSFGETFVYEGIIDGSTERVRIHSQAAGALLCAAFGAAGQRRWHNMDRKVHVTPATGQINGANAS